ncbi:hypothetical protein LDENG_00198140, partial [Lucifuga dentata]
MQSPKGTEENQDNGQAQEPGRAPTCTTGADKQTTGRAGQATPQSTPTDRPQAQGEGHGALAAVHWECPSPAPHGPQHHRGRMPAAGHTHAPHMIKARQAGEGETQCPGKGRNPDTQSQTHAADP